jgi:cell wall assembly regulator SMI1
LRGPATKDSIRNLQEQFSSKLPESYLASLRRHEGADSVDGFELLTIDRIIEIRQGLLDQLYAGKFDDRTPPPDVIAAKRIDRVWWNAAWIPFAKHSATGRLLFLDLDPWQHGIVGQILEWDSTKGPLGISADSFKEWLSQRIHQ